MKTIIRNLVSVARRFKLAVALNILGLSVAFAAFMIIMIQVNYDHGFDRFHKDSDKIFRVERNQGSWKTVLFSRPLAERFFESSPHIIAGAITQMNEFQSLFHVENDDVQNFYRENSLFVTPEFFDVFTFDFVEGSANVHLAPESVFIPLSLSRKLFGNEPAVGKQIVHSNWGNQTVAGVYRDLPANSIINNCIYFAMQPHENRDSWDNHNYVAYVRLNHASNAPLLFDNFKRTFDAPAIWGENFDWDESNQGIWLTALPDVHFVTDLAYDNSPKSSKQTLSILFAIAIVIILIATINFTNFSTALAPMRVKSINTQHILGLQRNKIRFSLVFEAITISLLSYAVALLLVDLFKNTPLVRLIDADLAYSSNLMIIGGSALIALLVGIFAGLYPARHLTAFAPAFALKGSFALSPKGKSLRSTLTGIQFFTSFALIIVASFMFLQNHFMQNTDMGFHKDELIVVDVGSIRERDAFANELKSHAAIDAVTFGERLLSSSDNYMGWGQPYKGENITFQVLPVHHTFIEAMGIEITEGRGFRPEDANMQHGVFVFNETARQRFNMEVGSTVGQGTQQGEIVGFMPDVKFASFRVSVAPMAFYVWGTQNWGTQPNVAYIRLTAGANKRVAMSNINSTLAEFTPNPFLDVRFFDEVMHRLYEKEKSISSLISLFSFLAIFISIVGVFGLVVFDSERRRKEIGIRKVHGASVLGIIVMFNKAYFKILTVCFVIAAPLAWYAVNRWLESFAYKTPMHWWVYFLAFAAIALITVCTVTFQNWKVANDDPVKSIKTE